jgi:hypothetical protein
MVDIMDGQDCMIIMLEYGRHYGQARLQLRLLIMMLEYGRHYGRARLKLQLIDNTNQAYWTGIMNGYNEEN